MRRGAQRGFAACPPEGSSVALDGLTGGVTDAERLGSGIARKLEDARAWGLHGGNPRVGPAGRVPSSWRSRSAPRVASPVLPGN